MPKMYPFISPLECMGCKEVRNMALNVTALDSKVQVKLNHGTDEEGKTILRLKTYTSIKSATSDQDVYDVVAALMGLQEHAVESVKCVSEETYENLV
jgi:hypothetical protein